MNDKLHVIVENVFLLNFSGNLLHICRHVPFNFMAYIVFVAYP